MKLNTKIPSNIISYMTICGGIIVLIVLLVILPFYRYNSNRVQEIKKIKISIDEQKGLKQPYEMLKNESQKKENGMMLPNPVKTKLPRQDVEKFQSTFRAEAGKAGLMTLSMVPDIRSMAGGSHNLLYDVTLRGQFTNVRKLLIGLGAIPYIDQIEEISMRQFQDSMEIRMKIWIALTN